MQPMACCLLYCVLTRASGGIIDNVHDTVIRSIQKDIHQLYAETAQLTARSQDTRVVLVAEDDENIRELLGLLLESEGYDAVLVGDGVEALTYLRNNLSPCCILLDLEMPVMDGQTFLEQHRDHAPHVNIPVVVMSATMDGADVAKEVHVAAYLSKPFRVEQLLVVLEQVCQRTT